MSLLYETFHTPHVCDPYIWYFVVIFLEIILKTFHLQVTAESKIFKGQIAENFFLSTSHHKDVEYVHIRRYEKSEDGQKSFPTKKGASFTPGR